MTLALLFLAFLIVAFAVVIGLYVYGVRTAIRRKGAELTESWDLLLRAMHDRAETLPKLVEDVKHTTGFEEKIFEDVLAASKNLADAKVASKVCEAILAGRDACNNLYRIVEYYPRLEAEPAWLALKAEATEAELRIERERGIYNRNAREFNRLISKSLAGRTYAQRANLLECETVEQHGNSSPAHPTTSPVQLAATLG